MDRLTLLDLAQRSGNNASLPIVEGLVQRNGLLERLPFSGIIGDSFKYLRRTSLPDVSFRGYNQGITATKSSMIPIRIETKMIGGRSIVDKNIAENAIEGINLFRAKEDISFLASMANKYNFTAYYGNSSTNPLEYDGFATILNALSKESVVNAGAGSGAVTSIYLASFKEATTNQGNKPGVQGLLGNNKLPQAIDMGLQYVNDADGKQYLAYVTELEFNPGLAVYEDIAIGRICNINSSNKPSEQDFIDVVKGMMPFDPDVILCNKEGWGYLQTLSATQTYSYVDPATNRLVFVRTIFGKPIVIDDNISSAETVVA